MGQDLSAIQETQVLSLEAGLIPGTIWYLGWKDPLEKGMANHSSILVWRILWTEEPGGMALHRVGQN